MAHLSDTERSTVAAELREAEKFADPVEPITERWSQFDVEDAYAVQLINVDSRIAAGGVLRGHKVGLTSRVMQEMLGVNEPDYGHLLEDMFVGDGDAVAVAALCAPRAEMEIAFHLARRLEGPGCTVADVAAACDHVTAAIEIIDSRIRDWKLTLPDTVADNGSSARAVVGSPRVPYGTVDLVATQGVLLRNGEKVESGTGAAVLGDPAAAVAWLVNKLAEFGAALEAGSVVLPGACARAVPVAAGDTISAEFDGIGGVKVSFT